MRVSSARHRLGFMKNCSPIRVVYAALVLILICGSSAAQETGGGSTENFKRPSNPPVHQRRKPADQASGGRVAPSETPKPGGRSKGSENAAIVGIPPGDTPSGKGEPPKPRATPTAGSGIAGSLIAPNVIPRPVKPPPPPGAGLPAEIDEELEDALAAGNAARDAKPSDNDGAERAYKRAAAIAPDDARPYEGLGHIYLELYRNEEAAAAYGKAVELKSQNPQVFEGLADAYYRLRKYNEAIVAATESIRLNPKPPGAFYTRALVNSTLGRGNEAGDDAQAFIERWSPSFAGTPPYYITFVGYLGYWEAGRKDDADKLLAQASKSSCQDGNWICRILKFLKHEVTAEQLLSEADTNDKMTEARTYIGIDLALSGHRQEALPHLRWVVENGNKRFTEYLLAEAWVAKLERH